MHRTRSNLHKSPEIRFLGGGFHDAMVGQNCPLHRHTCWEFVYYRSGSITCVHGEDCFTAEPGLLWLTPPGTDHAELACTAYKNIYFSFIAPPSMPWPRMILDDEQQNFRRLCSEIVLEHDKDRDSPLGQLLLEELFFRIERANGTHKLNPATQIVHRAEHIIASSLGNRPKIQDIAKEAGASVSGLRAAFQSVRGKSPLAVLRETRCQRAVAMLQNSTLTLEALAEICGYDSASHLSREIKRSTGKSPGRFRDPGKSREVVGAAKSHALEEASKAPWPVSRARQDKS